MQLCNIEKLILLRHHEFGKLEILFLCFSIVELEIHVGESHRTRQFCMLNLSTSSTGEYGRLCFGGVLFTKCDSRPLHCRPPDLSLTIVLPAPRRRVKEKSYDWSWKRGIL